MKAFKNLTKPVGYSYTEAILSDFKIEAIMIPRTDFINNSDPINVLLKYAATHNLKVIMF